MKFYGINNKEMDNRRMGIVLDKLWSIAKAFLQFHKRI